MSGDPLRSAKLRKISISRLLFTAALSVCAAITAEPVDLYEYHSLVETQTRPERNQATADGLAEIIIRASGQARVLNDPGVKKALNNPSRYLLEYRYQSTDKTIQVDNKTVPAYDLVLKFSGSSVEKLLREQQLPIWPANRPSVMVWLVVDGGKSKQIISEQYLPEGIEAVEASGAQRGLPVITPQGDLDDQVAISAKKIWQLDERSIRRASERYNPDSILVGRLTKTSQSRWRASWLLINENRSKTFDSTGSGLFDVVGGGIADSADYFFQLYGYEPTGGVLQTFMFSIDGVLDFGGYVTMMKYLEGISVVRGVDLVAANNENVLLQVSTEVNLNALEQAIALDDRLEKGYQNTGSLGESGLESNPSSYRWRN